VGGFFGAVSEENVLADVFFGTDYHSHLGTKSAGIAAFDREMGLQRDIHNIGNAPFRTKFSGVFDEIRGTAAIGTINDTDPQPLLVRSALGRYAISFVGVINNKEELIEEYIRMTHGQLGTMSGGDQNTAELVASYINLKDSFAEGIRFLQEKVKGTVLVLILTENNSIIAARDRAGRLPVHIGKKEGATSVSFEDFAQEKLDYETVYELKAGEVVELFPDRMEILLPGTDEMHICSFLWSYYGYPTASYEGVNVERMRYRNGEILAEHDRENGILPEADYVAGVPDSGTPHAIGYANESHLHFSRPFIKYTPTWPRSFTSPTQVERNQIAKMKQIPVNELIRDKELLFVDDSIVRGTQIRETVEFLYESGAGKVHMRSACPPIMYGCKFLNFSRSTGDMELITRNTILELEGEEGFNYLEEYSDSRTERGKRLRAKMCERLHLASLEFQTLEGLQEAIGIEPCKLCTYCWNGKE
jgi:amidophosphoribosyltransferase